MLKFIALLGVILAMSMALPDSADARRFGGGGSFGKSFKTKPAQSAPAAGATQSASKSGPAKRGLMGGVLGGLLAGGLIAALLGGAFDGIQFMDVLIIGLLAFVGFRLFRGLRSLKPTLERGASGELLAGNAPIGQATNRFQSSTEHGARWANGGSSTGGATVGFGDGTDVPLTLPDGFDINAFVAGARDHFRTVQDAWNHNDMEKIREYLSPELFDEMCAQRRELAGDQHTEVMFVDAEIVRAQTTAILAQISVRFSGRFRDVEEQTEADIDDIWHLERDLSTNNAPWLIVGIEGS